MAVAWATFERAEAAKQPACPLNSFFKKPYAKTLFNKHKSAGPLIPVLPVTVSYFSVEDGVLKMKSGDGLVKVTKGYPNNNG